MLPLTPRYRSRIEAELEAVPSPSIAAFGEALDPDKLERLGRDRKLERTLAMLLKLKELRSNPAEV